MKTHYRKVFKSDHLSVADLEDLTENKISLVFTISQVKQEIGAKVAGKTGNFNIAYFDEDIKPLVLNATNSKIIKDLTGSNFVEDWRGIRVQLYIDPNAKFAGEVVGGVRISPYRQPKKITVTPDNKDIWERAKNSYKMNGNFDAILQHANISEENKSLIEEECNNEVS
jgi:hypothetical protein